MGQILKAHRFFALWGAGLLTLVCLALAPLSTWFLLAAVVFAGLTLVGLYDVRQTRHAILRNYPILGHMRFIFEGIRPEIRQYLIESDQDEEPFSREQRSIVYQRAKGVEDKRPFGTQERVYDAGYAWLTHSIQPRPSRQPRRPRADRRAGLQAALRRLDLQHLGDELRVALGQRDPRAEPGREDGRLRPRHRRGRRSAATTAKAAATSIWEIGSGYFGCRDADGALRPRRVRGDRPPTRRSR